MRLRLVSSFELKKVLVQELGKKKKMEMEMMLVLVLTVSLNLTFYFYSTFYSFNLILENRRINREEGEGDFILLGVTGICAGSVTRLDPAHLRPDCADRS